MINLTDEMVSRLDSALADGYSCLVGTASKDGEPQISPKGSVMAFNGDTLAYWERAKRSALDNVAENPQVVVYYAHAADRVRWRFHGKATVHEDGPVRQEVMDRCVQAELDRDPERLGVAVLIKIEKIHGTIGRGAATSGLGQRPSETYEDSRQRAYRFRLGIRLVPGAAYRQNRPTTSPGSFDFPTGGTQTRHSYTCHSERSEESLVRKTDSSLRSE